MAGRQNGFLKLSDEMKRSSAQGFKFEALTDPLPSYDGLVWWELRHWTQPLYDRAGNATAIGHRWWKQLQDKVMSHWEEFGYGSRDLRISLKSARARGWSNEEAQQLACEASCSTPCVLLTLCHFSTSLRRRDSQEEAAQILQDFVAATADIDGRRHGGWPDLRC